MNKNLKITSIIIVLLIVIGMVVWFLMSKNQKNTNKPVDVIKEVQNETNQDVIPKKSGIQEEQKDKDEQTQNNQDVAELKTEDIDTSDWKEYCNEEYGFCLKYPDEWDIKFFDTNRQNKRLLDLKFFNENFDFIDNCEYIFLNINLLSKDIHQVDEMIKNNNIASSEYKFKNAKKQRVGNKIIVVSDMTPNFLETLFIHDRYWFHLEMGSDIGGHPITDECKVKYFNIVSTLKFTK